MNRSRHALGAVLLTLAGCSHVLGTSNAGIAELEEGPLGEVAVGAKYTGWATAAPLDLALAPVALLAWATPWFDLADMADIATAPSVGCGYFFQSIVAAPVAIARLFHEEPRDELPVPWGFVVEHHEGRERPPAPISSDTEAYYAIPAGAADRLAAKIAACEGPITVPLEGVRAVLEVTLAEGRGPLVLMTPPSQGTFAARWIAARYARNGVHAAVIVPLGEDGSDDDAPFLEPHLDAREIEAKIRASIVTARTVTQTLRRRDDVSRVVYLGISAGGIFGSLLVALEPSIERAVLVFPGGNLPRIVATSDEGTVERYRAAWVARGVDERVLECSFRAAVRTDPLALAPHVDPRRVLLFLSADDTVVPIACGVELRNALGEPETYMMAGNHETASLCFGWVLRRADAFLLEAKEDRR